MPGPIATDPSRNPTDAAGPSPIFLAIVLVEIACMVALYWFGRHFGSS